MSPSLRSLPVELYEFLTDYLAWIEAGAPDTNPHLFMRSVGLCSNARMWAFARNQCWETLQSDLRTHLKRDNLVGDFPFSNEADYFERATACTQHLLPARIQWVRSKIGV